MGSFIVSRLYETLFTLFIGSIFCFVFVRLLPGNPAIALYGENFLRLSDADQARIMENLGLNESVFHQYWKWLAGVLNGNWGVSYSTGEEVSSIISRAIGPTLTLMFASTVLILLLSLIFGIWTGLKRHSVLDYAVTTGSFILMSIPTFWFALMLILLFSVYLGVLPSSGIGKGSFSDTLKHLLLPSVVLALSHIGFYIRILRNHLAVMKEKEFIWALRARGVSNSAILFRHLLPNVSVPFLSYAGLSLSLTIGGSVVIETIFSRPGLGRLSLSSALAHDYPVILAIILLTMSTVVIGSFLIDLLCAAINPRLRKSLVQEGSAR